MRTQLYNVLLSLQFSRNLDLYVRIALSNIDSDVLHLT